MLFLPEASYVMGVSSGEKEVLASLASAQAELAGVARDSALWVSVGACRPSPDAADARVDNVHWLFAPDGALHAEYCKTHLFDATTSAGTLKESDYTRPGRSLVAARGTPIGVLGLMTCYDARFPAVSTALRFDGGADALAMPSAFTLPTGAAHWELLVRGRAVDTQCYVLAAAQGGDHGAGRATWGHSMVVDPWGTVLAQCGGDGPGLCFAELDPAVTTRVRADMPLSAQMRGDLPLSVVG